MASLRDRNPIVVGLVALTTLGVAVTATFLIGTLGLLDGGYTVTGVFSDTGGLRRGDDVRIAGVRVGQVTEVRPEFADTRVVVRWKVDRGVRLGASTRAEISNANLLGGRFIRLSGPVAAPYLADLPARRRVIPMERTQVPTQIGDVVDGGTRLLDRLDTASFDRILAEIRTLSAKDRGRAGHALRKLTELAESMAAAAPRIRAVLAGSAKLTDLVQTKDRQLARLLDQVQAMLKLLRNTRDELITILGDGGHAVRSTARLIDDQQAELTTIGKDLQTTMDALHPRRSALNSTLAWAGPVATGLGGMGGYGPWFEVLVTGLGPLSPKDLADLIGGGRE